MEITLLGTGAAWPDADRSSPAFLLQHQGIPFLIDCGGGTSHQLMKAGVPPSTLEIVLLTHIHIDHCVEFPSLVFGAYLTGKEGGFRLFGPPGTEHFAKSVFGDTYDFAIPMMKQLRKKDIVVTTREVESGRVLDLPGLEIESTPVHHGIPTIAYRFTAAGKSVVLSGDTAPCDNIVKIANEADLLIIECSFPEQAGPKPGHCIPSQVGKIAAAAKAKRVVLVHLFPPCKGKEDGMVEEIKRFYVGPVEVGRDLDRISV